jgi:hypothetical protein
MRLQLKVVERYYGSFWEIFSLMKYLLSHIKKMKEKYATDLIFYEFSDLDENNIENRKYIRTSTENCWGKFDEY